MHFNKKGLVTTITSLKHSYLRKLLIFVTRWYCTYNSSTDTNTFASRYLIAYDYTGHVGGSCLGTDISITSSNCNHQNCKPSCIYQVLKFQIESSDLFVTVEFTPFWGHLQLDHPVTCENIKCYSHIQILAWIKVIIFLITCFL